MSYTTKINLKIHNNLYNSLCKIKPRKKHATLIFKRHKGLSKANDEKSRVPIPHQHAEFSHTVSPQ